MKVLIKILPEINLIDAITSITVSPNGRFIASGSQDRSIKIFDVENKEEVYHFKEAHEALVSSLTVTSDNRFIISGSHDKSIKIFEVETKKQIQHFKDIQDSKLITSLFNIKVLLGAMFSVAVSPNGRYVVSGSDDKTLNLYSVDMHNPVHQFLDAHEGFNMENQTAF